MNKPKVKGTRELVEDIFKEHPDWNASQVWDRYKLSLGNPNNARGLSAIQKHLEKIKPRYINLQAEGLDIPWTMANIKDKGVPAEVIPYITNVQAWAKTQIDHIKPDDCFSLAREYLPITLRQAIWISRLYILAGDWRHLKEQNIRWLWAWSRAYSLSEMQSKLLGNDKHDSSFLDTNLIAGAAIDIRGKAFFVMPKDGKTYMGIADEGVLKQIKDGEANG
jgi:hypothetical protein